MIARLSLPLVGALAISLALFWMMQYLVNREQPAASDQKAYHRVEFVRLKRESEPPESKRRPLPEPPEKRQPPPPPSKPTVAPKPHPRVRSLTPALPQLNLPLDIAVSGLLNGVSVATPSVNTPNASPVAADTEIVPLVRISPQYPMRARQRGIEGWVKVEFTVTETGSVEDIQVIDAQPAHIFERAARRAIAKWRFRPKTVNGEPTASRAVQVLEFKLKS